MSSRSCDWCGESIAHLSEKARTCGDSCRAALHRWRHGLDAQTARNNRSNGERTTPANPEVAKEKRDRDRLRERRAAGPVPADQRISLTKAIAECERALIATGCDMDLVKSIAEDAMRRALPARFQQSEAA
jgi:hypothetical protein